MLAPRILYVIIIIIGGLTSPDPPSLSLSPPLPRWHRAWSDGVGRCSRVSDVLPGVGSCVIAALACGAAVGRSDRICGPPSPGNPSPHKDWRMFQGALACRTPGAPRAAAAACLWPASDPGSFMICGRHARSLAGKPCCRPACSGPNDRCSSGDSGGAEHPEIRGKEPGKEEEGRAGHRRRYMGAAVWARRATRGPGGLRWAPTPN